MMVILLTWALAVRSTERSRSWPVAAAWVAALTVQMMGFVLAATRGPSVALAIGVIVFLTLLLFTLGWRSCVRALAILGAAVAITVLVLFGPFPDPKASQADGESVATSEGVETVGPSEQIGSKVPLVVQQAASVAPGSLSQDKSFRVRLLVWETSGEMILERPYFEFDRGTPAFVLHLLGYGPELYGYVLSLGTPDTLGSDAFTLHSHNEIIQRTVEMGYLGILAFLAFLAAVFGIGLARIVRFRKSHGRESLLLLVAMLVTLGTWVIAQMVGVARVADTALFWALAAGVVVVLAPAAAEDETPPAEPEPQSPAAGSSGAPRVRAVVWTFALALFLAAALLLFSWARNVNYVRAAVEAAAAQRSIESGDLGGGLVHVDRAISLAPDVSRYHSGRAEIMDLASRGIITRGERAIINQASYLANRRAVAESEFAIYPRFRLAHTAMVLALSGDPEKGKEALDHYLRHSRPSPAIGCSSSCEGALSLSSGSPIWRCWSSKRRSRSLARQWHRRHRSTCKALRTR